MRFHGYGRTDAAAADYANADGVDRVALIGRHGDRIVAAAGYDVLREPGAAEVAFAVADDFQGRGAATRMLEQLAAIAAERGIHRFDAEVMQGNRAMITRLRARGLRRAAQERVRRADRVAGPQPQRGRARPDRRPRPPRRGGLAATDPRARLARGRRRLERAGKPRRRGARRTSSPEGSRAWPRPSTGTAGRPLDPRGAQPGRARGAARAGGHRGGPRRGAGRRRRGGGTRREGAADPHRGPRRRRRRGSSARGARARDRPRAPACAWSGRTASACSTATLRCASTPRSPARRCPPAASRSARSPAPSASGCSGTRRLGGSASRASPRSATAPTSRRTTCWSYGRRTRARPR